VHAYVSGSDVDALRKLLCPHGLQYPMFSLYACRQALLRHLLMGQCASAFEFVGGDCTACLDTTRFCIYKPDRHLTMLLGTWALLQNHVSSA
jgi:hypothetical protein